MTDILKLLEPAGENATDDIIRQIRFYLTLAIYNLGTNFRLSVN